MRILGLESSCDETSVALLNDGRIEANEIYSQKNHAKYGGVVPEIASRAHIQKIDRLCNGVLKQCGCTLKDIDLIAVTDRPGLAGALLVGISFGLGLHCGYGIPISGVNHIEGHIASVLLEYPELPFPFIALVVSGGHSALYRVDDFTSYARLGATIDDAAGEAFDKVGKLLGFSYPAGRSIENEALKFTGTGLGLRFPVAKVSQPGFNFSFSGLKTSVKYFLTNKSEEYKAQHLSEICHSFQKAVIDALLTQCIAAAEDTGIKSVVIVGGVACNGSLRKALKNHFGDNVFFPPPGLCTDNAAMIAKAGLEMFKRKKTRFPAMDPIGSL